MLSKTNIKYNYFIYLNASCFKSKNYYFQSHFLDKFGDNSTGDVTYIELRREETFV